MDAIILASEKVLINAGRRGVMLKMAPQDILSGLNCVVAEVSEA
jgi:prolyl-tRNA editing enzyme YbaK/EbsC (Cys-tRNA(Pro) deacylase)